MVSFIVCAPDLIFFSTRLRRIWYCFFLILAFNDILKQFGYKIDKLFEPTITELYEPDIVYNLTENQNLSDIDIKWSYTKINHLYAGCSLGKTYNAKELGKQKVIEVICIWWSIVYKSLIRDILIQVIVVEIEHKGLTLSC